MTLVVAEQTPEGIFAGADSAMTGGPDHSEIYDLDGSKIILREGYLFGYCGSSRIGQVLAHYVKLPKIPEEGELLSFLARELVPSVREAVQEHGAAYEGNLILGPRTVVIVGCRGELFHLTADLVVLSSPGTVAIGSGRKHAYGALEALQRTGYGTPRERLEIALEIGAKYTTTVRGPWTFCRLPK